MRCKVFCSYKLASTVNDNVSIAFSPVYTGSEENKKFFAATPGGTIIFDVVNKAAVEGIKVGTEYYLDFTEAPSQL